jgi:hypothetical protein
VAECGSVAFLPAHRAREVVRGPTPKNWQAFLTQPDAISADWASLQVSIQGESVRKITLTGIRFFSKRLQRPAGATFSAPCGGPVSGRGLEVDVEADPPRIVASSKGKGGAFGPGDPLDGVKPITWPWTVSLTDPLLLYIVASAESCFCVWGAEISWVSGDERGTIQIDNDGKGYPLVGSKGVAGYSVKGTEWGRYVLRNGKYVWLPAA